MAGDLNNHNVIALLSINFLLTSCASILSGVILFFIDNAAAVPAASPMAAQVGIILNEE